MLKKTLFTGFRFTVDELREGDVIRHCVDHPGAVVIVPLLDDQNVVLIKNKRECVGQTLIEFPAGTLEKGEEPLDCAKRELIEETGYQAAHVTPMFSCYSTPGFCNEILHFFEARDLTHVGQDLDDGEEIEPFTLPLTEALAWIKEGKIVDMKTIASLLFLSR